MKKNWMSLTRTGELAFTVIGENHCGIATNGQRQKANYVVIVKCAPVLDKRDYLVEQRTIDNYMQTIDLVKYSCERLSQIVARGLVEVIRGENPDIIIKWIEVEIMPEPYKAYITYRYHP